MEHTSFVVSYSGGKDSALALWRAVQRGMEPAGMITTCNTNLDRSWFHGIPNPLLEQVSRSLNIPLTLIPTAGEDYEEKFLEVLKSFRERGVEACVFGDIDIPSHLQWGMDICKKAGMEAVFPLWQEPREALVRETVSLGFQAKITVVNKTMLSESHLGQVLSESVLDSIRREGADVCGENGEYHTFVFDGPLFSRPVAHGLGEIHRWGNYAALPLLEK